MCEPSDVGAYIKAKISSSNEGLRGEGEVTIGPIGIDLMMKRLIDGALYANSLLSQVVLSEKNKKTNLTIRLTNRTMEFVDEASQIKIIKEYSISEPKI